MPYETPDGRRRPLATGGSPRSGRRAGTSLQRRTVAGQVYHGPQGTQTRPGARRGSSRGKGGYPLRNRNISFQRGRRGGGRRNAILLGAAAVLLAIVLVVGIGSCVRGCSASDGTGEVNEVDSRVAYGVSEGLTQRLAAELDQGELMAQIAANADRYEDEALIELALDEPSAIAFVAAYPDAARTASDYGEQTTRGSVPQLYTWDSRWGAVDYAGSALALTGSGPVALQMAYIGLTGNADRTAADIAELVSAANQATGDSGMSADFLSEGLADLGLSVSGYTSSADNLTYFLDAGTYILIEAGAGTLTDDAHWVLLVTENENGTIVVHDPTSTEVTARSWLASDLAAAATNGTLYAITATSTNEE